MFDRFTEEARQVIFWARYEASQAGSPEITPEHLLLGWMRQAARIGHQSLLSPDALDSIRKMVEAQSARGEKISTSVDLPLNHLSKRAHWLMAPKNPSALGTSTLGPITY